MRNKLKKTYFCASKIEDMAKQTDKTDKQFAQIEETLSRTEQYIEDNQKSLVVIVGVLLLLSQFIFLLPIFIWSH